MLRLSQYVIDVVMDTIELVVVDDSFSGSLFVDLLGFIRFWSHSLGVRSGLSA